MNVWKRLAGMLVGVPAGIRAGTVTAGPVVLTGLGTVAVPGGRTLILRHASGSGALDQSLAMSGFVCLLALGIGRTVVLIARVREEARRTGHQPGVRRAAAVVHAAVASASMALAVAFSVLAVPPLVSLAVLGAIAGLGVLLGTVVVRRVPSRVPTRAPGRVVRVARPEPVRSLVPDAERELVDAGVR